MGSASSSSGSSSSSPGPSLTTPFPVAPIVKNELNKLSGILERLLTTADVYDISGMSKAGRGDKCGNYVVFLREDIERSMMGLSVKVGDKRHEVLYQSVTQAIKDTALRESICSAVRDVSLRVILTVVALLASIQIGMGETIVVPPEKPTDDRRYRTDDRRYRNDDRHYLPQQGGAGSPPSIEPVYTFFYKNRYFDRAFASGAKPATTDNTQHTLKSLGNPGVIPYVFQITFKTAESNMITGEINAKVNDLGAKPRQERAIPELNFTLKIKILYPIKLAKDVLVICILDDSNKVISAGILYDNMYKPFPQNNPSRYLFETLLASFAYVHNRTQVADGRVDRRPHENIQNIQTSSDLFETLRRDNDDNSRTRTLINAMYPFLQSAQLLVQEYRLPGQGVGVGPGLGPGLGPGVGLGQGLGVGPGPGPGQAPQITGRRYNPYPVFADKTNPAVVPLKLSTKLANVRKLYLLRSSPAKVRAEALAGELDTNIRQVRTGVCRDAYWGTGPSSIDKKYQYIDFIFPWTTLQYLYVNTITAIGDDSNVAIDSDSWNAEFKNPLMNLYPPAEGEGPRIVPTLVSDVSNNTLEHMWFDRGKTGLSICKITDKPTVPFQPVQEGIQQLHELYNAHVKSVWGILNELIQVLVDPKTRAETVRLHPNVTRGESDGDSDTYVKTRAHQARKLIAAFYVNVEEIYINALRKMTPEK